MRWFLLSCVLLVTVSNALSIHRPKRDLSYIKNLIATKLFGAETIVIQQPEIPKNETYQLFKIKGYDDILLKVIRKPEAKKENVQVVNEKVTVVTEKLEDPVIVSPEIAIIGSYLGTSTQGETLLAIEIAKMLLKSGILSGERDKLIEEVIAPMTPRLTYKDYIAQKHMKPVNVFAEESEPIYVLPSVNDHAERISLLNRNSVPVFPAEYPSMVVASETKYRPLQTKYSYEQKGETADMTYESYNNQDVIVTRTVKEPPLPQYIKLRFAEVASIGANPYLITSQQPVGVYPQEHIVQPMNILPGSYVNTNPPIGEPENIQAAPIPSYVMERFPLVAKPVPSFGVAEESGYVVASNINSFPTVVNRNPTVISEPLSVPNFIKQSRLPFDIRDHLTEEEVDIINKYINEKLNLPNDSVMIKSKKAAGAIKVFGENENKDQKEAAIEGRKSLKVPKYNELNGQIVTKYLYKQMNHNSHDNYTVVKVGDPPKLNHSDLAKTTTVISNDEIPEDFIYVPPENIDVSLPNMIPRTNNIHDRNNNSEEVSSKTENYPKTFDSNQSRGDIEDESIGIVLKTSDQHSLKNDPIVVLEEKSDQNRYRVRQKHTGGKTTGLRPYTGGPMF